MTRARSVLVLLIALVMGVFFAIPAEDLPETAYDESESLPYEGTPVVSIAGPEIVVEKPAMRPCASRSHLRSLRTADAQFLERGTRWAHPICDSLPILDRSLRC